MDPRDQALTQKLADTLKRLNTSSAQAGALKASIDAACSEIKQIRADRTTEPDRMPYPIRRRELLKSIAVRSKHYALQDEVQLFVYQLGQETLQGLGNAELEGIHRWLERMIDGMETNVN